MDQLIGKPLHYLIGADAPGYGDDHAITVVAYDVQHPLRHGISAGYCNLFDETNSGHYGPYLRASDTAAEYNEGQIDPRGPGWQRNLHAQFERRRRAGFAYVELDNPDAYDIRDVVGAITMAEGYGLAVIAKNPALTDDPHWYLAHRNIVGAIIERDAGTPEEMDQLRRAAGKSDLPVWFVAFGDGRGWAQDTVAAARHYFGMGVTYANRGEYGDAVDLLRPRT